MSSKGKQKKKKFISEEKNCLFCSVNERDVLKYGKMYKFNDIYVHYYCLLLSSGLIQNGRDSEGIFGFLEEDIYKEWRRGEKLKCGYCKTIGATIGCSVKACKQCFHLPCGQKNKALNQFFESFDSFCVKHRPRQTLDPSHEINEMCPTCYSNVEFDEGIQVLTTPCCHKLFHRICLQKQALSSGYFFKCPLCNNGQQFIETMNRFGVYVPKQDASWETENNAFGELYQRYSHCDREKCLCPNGREYKDERMWQLLICHFCGSKGTHWTCLGCSDWPEGWVCDECKAVEQRVANGSNNSSDVQSYEDSENDIEIISNVITSQKENKIKISTIKLSNDSNKLFEIKDDIPVKRQKKSEMKDVAIQCTLVDAKDLIDTEPIEELDPYIFRNSTITLSNIKKSEEKPEIIDIEDSDDEILLLN